MEWLFRICHVLNFVLDRFDLEAQNVAPGVEQGRPVGGEIGSDHPKLQRTPMSGARAVRACEVWIEWQGGVRGVARQSRGDETAKSRQGVAQPVGFQPPPVHR